MDYTSADRPHDSGKDWSDRYHGIEPVLADVYRRRRAEFVVGKGCDRRDLAPTVEDASSVCQAAPMSSTHRA